MQRTLSDMQATAAYSVCVHAVLAVFWVSFFWQQSCSSPAAWSGACTPCGLRERPRHCRCFAESIWISNVRPSACRRGPPVCRRRMKTVFVYMTSNGPAFSLSLCFRLANSPSLFAFKLPLRIFGCSKKARLLSLLSHQQIESLSGERHRYPTDPAALTPNDRGCNIALELCVSHTV